MENSNFTNLKKTAVGTILAVSICTLAFGVITQSVKASIINKTQIVPTKYSATENIIKKPNIPKGYVKANYKVKINESQSGLLTKGISGNKAAEIGASDLWRLFKADLNGKTIEMSYSPASDIVPSAYWMGIIKINENLTYIFSVDVVTGNCLDTGKERYWPADNIKTSMNLDLMKNCETYLSKAKELAKKYNLVSGKIVSSKYASQGYNSSDYGKNSVIDVSVTSDTGQKAQLTFSTYNQEFICVEYDDLLKSIEQLHK